MFLLEQKANNIMSKIAFSKEAIRKVKSPDNVLETYIEPLMNWLDVLRNRVEQAKADFQEFVRDASFVQDSPLRGESPRKLLAVILRDFEDIERRLYIGVDTFLPLILVWNSQKSRTETRLQHKLLMRFITDLLQFCHMSESMLAIIGEDYACLPLEWAQVRKHVVFGTYSEMQNLSKWVLLAHELGHVYYYQNAEKINRRITPQVIRRLNENRPINLDQRDFESIIYIWTQHWIPEFVSDCFAAKTLGPAFITQFMMAALDSQPNRIEPTHPPPNLRLGFMMDILETLSLSDIDINSYRNIWQSYAHAVSGPSSLFIIHEEVVMTAMRDIDLIVTEKPIESKWADILEARKTLFLGSIPDQDFLSVVSALAIAESSINPTSVYKAMSKRYSGSSNTPQRERC